MSSGQKDWAMDVERRELESSDEFKAGQRAAKAECTRILEDILYDCKGQLLHRHAEQAIGQAIADIKWKVAR